MAVLNLLFLTFLCSLQTAISDNVVMTKNGPIQGILIENEGILLDAYLGVPYAEPPTGRLRFAKPVPKTPWIGVYDASWLSPTCVQNQTEQYYYTPDISNMTEDCLYLNIWVPHSTMSIDTKLKPIVIFIHGGAFNIGAANMKVYDGAKMAAIGDIIFVSINYRIGVMGYFSAFIPDADGNMGMFDQLMAISWVKDNALSFGGDPDNIVLLGHSAGAISVAGHIVSPLSKHMMKRVILQSGAAMLPFAFDENSSLYKVSQSIAMLVGCADKTVTIENNPRIIVECMKRLPPEELSRAEGILMSGYPITFIPRTGDSYLPKNSIALIRNGDFADIEMLSGIVKDEGTFFLAASLPQYFGVNGMNPSGSISKRLAYQMTKIMFKTLGQKREGEISDFYINNIENGTSEKYTKAISEAIGDYMIGCNSMFQAEFHSIRRNRVYYYKFGHRSSSSPLADWMGVTHFDDVQFATGVPLMDNFTEDELVTSHRVMKRWLAFVKTGNPNIENAVHWPLFSYDNPTYLEINEQETVRTRPDNYRCEFWRDRYQAGIDNNIIKKISSSSTSDSSNQLISKFIFIVSTLLSFLIVY